MSAQTQLAIGGMLLRLAKASRVPGYNATPARYTAFGCRSDAYLRALNIVLAYEKDPYRLEVRPT